MHVRDDTVFSPKTQRAPEFITACATASSPQGGAADLISGLPAAPRQRWLQELRSSENWGGLAWQAGARGTPWQAGPPESHLSALTASRSYS